MKPNFALSLSFDKVELLHREGTGWVSVGDVPVDTDDLDGALAALRQKALLLDPDGLRTKLILPDEQVKFLGIAEADADDAAVRAALDGATPYAVDDLVYEFAKEGRRTLIAAVARETLEEAEAFALAHHFAPVSIVAKSVKGRFDGEPYFGMTRAASILLADGDSVERDNPPAAIRKALAKAVAPETKATVVSPAEPTAPSKPEAPATTSQKATSVTAATAALPDVDKPTPPQQTDVTSQAPPAPSTPAPVFSSRQRSKDVPANPLEAAVVSMKSKPVSSQAATRILPESGATPPVSEGVSDRLERASRTDLNKNQPFPSITDPKSPNPKQEAEIEPSELAATLERTPSQPIVPSMNKGGGGLFASRRAPDPVSKPLSAKPDEAATAPAISAKKPRTGSTVFDQKAEEARKKPKYLWLVLTVLLLLAMLAIALFSNLFDGTESAESADAAASNPLIIVQPAYEVAAQDVTPDGPTEQADNDPLVLAAPDVTAPLPLPEVPAFEAAPSAIATQNADDDVAAQIIALLETASQSGTPLAADVVENPAPPARQDTADAQDIVTADTPVGTVPSPDEAIAFYNATGVWLRAPRLVRPTPSRANTTVTSSGNAAITRPELASVLPPISTLFPDTKVARQSNPPGPNIVFARDARGFFQATPTGTRSPSGMLIYAGLPATVPPTRPGTIAPPIQRVSVTPNVRNAQNNLTVEAPQLESETSEEITDLDTAETETPVQPALDARGLVVATPDGAVSASGMLVFEGVPEVVPPNRPSDLAAQTQTLADDVTAVLGSVALDAEADTPERVAFAGPRPGPRPESLVPADQEAIASAIAEATQNPQAAGASVAATLAAIVSSAPDPLVGATSQAVARARLPEQRPQNFDRVVASAQARQASLQTTAPAAPRSTRGTQPETVSSAPAQPTGNIPQSVAAAATVENAISLREINLISVAGRPGDRRALIRMPNGQFLRVQVGDALDGGRVTAIGDNVINYVRRGNTVALGIPG